MQLAILFVLAVLTFLLPAWNRPALAAPPNRFAALEANEWLPIEPEVSKRLVLLERSETSGVKEIESREPYFREYTQPAWDAARGQILYFGGGHSGYYGNDVEIYDVTTNVWRQASRPHCPAKDDSTYYSGGSERCYVDPDTGDCQPYVIHGYCRTAFDPDLKRYVCTAMFATKVEQDAGTKEWKLVKQAFSYISYDPATNRWELLAEVPDPLKPGLTSLSYDSELKGMVAFNEREAWLFKEKSWHRIAESTEGRRLAASGGSGAVFVPQKGHLIAVLGHGGKDERGSVVLFDSAAKETRYMPLPEELAKRVAPGTGGYNLILGYDSNHARVVAMSVNDDLKPDVWTNDLAGSGWKQLPAAPTAPKLVGPFEPGRGRSPLIYDAERNAFLLLYRNGEFAKLWAYRLEK